MKFFEVIFVSPDGRIRAGWRLLMQLVLSLLFMIPLYLLASQVGGRNMQIIASGIAISLAVWAAGWMLDKRPVWDYGLRINSRWWKDCFSGVVMATLVMTLLVLFQWIMGWLDFTGFGWNRSSERSFLPVFGGYLVTMAVVGFYEELWSRGYQLTNLTEGFYHGWNRNMAGAIAIAISSVVFGVLHLSNPNATLFGMVVIILAGVMLAIPYVVTGQLGLSVGLHFAWNFIQGGIYGLPVSGIPFRQSIIQTRIDGPDLWTGGAFGPEGGIVGLIGVIVLIICSVFWLYYRGYSITVSSEITRPPAPRDY